MCFYLPSCQSMRDLLWNIIFFWVPSLMHCVVPAIDSFAYVCEFIFFIYRNTLNYDVFILFCCFIMLYHICIGIYSWWFRIILINTLSLGISLIALGLWISFPFNVNFMYSVILIITLAIAQVIDQVDMSWVDPRFTVFLTAFLK